MPGKMPAHMTAKSVIASAARLIDVRHFWRVQEKNRRDQRAGVADTDPEHEVGDVPRPAVRMVFTPDTDAVRDLVTDADQAEQRDGRGDEEADPPPERRPAFDDVGDRLGDPRQTSLIGTAARAEPGWEFASASRESRRVAAASAISDLLRFGAWLRAVGIHGRVRGILAWSCCSRSFRRRASSMLGLRMRAR